MESAFFSKPYKQLILGVDCVIKTFIPRTWSHTTLNLAKEVEQNFERDRKNCLLSLDFDKISEIFVEEKTI